MCVNGNKDCGNSGRDDFKCSRCQRAIRMRSKQRNRRTARRRCGQCKYEGHSIRTCPDMRKVSQERLIEVLKRLKGTLVGGASGLHS